MSDAVVAKLAKSLGLTNEQAGALWLKTRQAMLETLTEGQAVDAGFAYITQVTKASRRRHDFGAGTTVVSPASRSFKIMVPPHIRQVLDGHTELNPYVWLTRHQYKQLDSEEKVHLESIGCGYYNMKGVTV